MILWDLKTMIRKSDILRLLQFFSGSRIGVVSPGCTDADLVGFTKETGMPLPQDLREWLKLANGVEVGACLFGFHGSNPELNIEQHLKLAGQVHIINSWKQEKWIPVGNDGCGNYYLLPTTHEFGKGLPILFMDSISESIYIVSSDLGHFLLFFLERERDLGNDMTTEKWPFNKDYVTTHDPHILSFRGISFPWSLKS